MSKHPSSFLVVVAHPDDEVLGFGGTASVLTSRGHKVTACILSGGAEARASRPSDQDLHTDTIAASNSLGMEEPILGAFPNIEMNLVPHLELVQFVESAMRATRARHVITHHPGDLNDDHRHTSRAAQAAARLSQRTRNRAQLISLSAMEVPSSTDWAFGGADRAFVPTSFFEVGEQGVQRKLDALACYQGVTRAYPHPRSPEVVRSWAVVRGAQSGVNHAECFQTLYFDLTHVLVL